VTLADVVQTHWTAVAVVAELPRNRGVCALIGARQIALFRTDSDVVYAIDNYDPFSRANVVARGVIGDRDGIPKVASPIYKQSFDLRTGVCLDDPAVSIPVYAVRVRNGEVQVACPR
jgi:nitrite reductase (NADH) small subunit